MKWRVIFLLAAVVIGAFMFSSTEAGKKKEGRQRGEKGRICGAVCDRTDSDALEALIIEKRREFSRGAQDLQNPQHDIEIKQRYGIITRYISRRVDLIKLYGVRPMRHL